MNKWERKKNKFVHFLSDPSDPKTLSYNHTFFITGDKDGRMWIGTMGKGVDVYDPRTGEFTRLSHDPDNIESLSNNDVNHIYADRNGIIWVGTTWGLNQYQPGMNNYRRYQHIPYYQNSLSANRVNDICSDKRGNIWISTNNGLNYLEIESRRFHHYFNIPGQENSLSNSNTYCVYEDIDGSIWIGTLTGLDHLDPKKNEFTHFVHEADRPSSLSNSRILSVYRDSSGHLWVGTWIGLNRSISGTDEFERFFENPENPGEWFKNSFIIILEDSSGDIWFGTKGGGLYRYHKGSFSRFQYLDGEPGSICSDWVFDLYQDSKGRLWAATSGGLCLKSSENQTGCRFTRYGDYQDSVLAIVEDNQGFLWLSTPHSIFRMDPDRISFENMETGGGLNFKHKNIGAAVKALNGELFFGGMGGLVSFYPTDIRPNLNIPPVVITGITLHGKQSTPEMFYPEDGKMKISYRDFPVHLEFAALDFSRTLKNQYAYKIEGMNDEWIFIGQDRSITITRLDPGSYVFRVKATNSNGIWNEEGCSLTIMVTPPFWKTWWFRLGLAFLSILLIFNWHRTRMKRLSAKLKSEAATDRFLMKHHISDREREVVFLLLKGKSNKEIEDMLFISLGTVKNHIYNIFKKLKVKNRVQLITLFKNLDR